MPTSKVQQEKSKQESVFSGISSLLGHHRYKTLNYSRKNVLTKEEETDIPIAAIVVL